MQYDMLLAIIADFKKVAASAFFSSKSMISVKYEELPSTYTSGSYDPGIKQVMRIKF